MTMTMTMTMTDDVPGRVSGREVFEELVACSQSESNSSTIQYPSVQEYVAGQDNIKGNVPVEEYIAISEDFAIGVNKDGYAVFKNSEKHWLNCWNCIPME